MFHAEHFGYTMGSPAFHFSSLKWLKQLSLDFIDSCDHMNKAMADGKALNQLRDKLAGPFSVKDVVVRESVRHSEELVVDVLVPNEITAAEELRIKTESIKVNLRYGSRIRIHVIVNSRRKE